MGQRMRGTLLAVGAAAVLAGGLLAGAGGALAQDDSSALIDAEVIADIAIEGGDAAGGDAVGGDAGLAAVVTGDEGGDVHVSQEAGQLEGGDAVGGDAAGGDGLNAFVDAVVVLDADVALDVAADVQVDTVGGADVAVSDLPVDLSGQQVVAEQPVDGGGLNLGDLDLGESGVVNGLVGGTDLPGTVDDALGGTDAPGTGRGGLGLPDVGEMAGGLTGGDTGGAADSLGGALGGALGGLGGLQLLDLFLDAEITVAGGDAAAGDAVAGSALIEAAVAAPANGTVNLDQEATQVFAGDATGGASVGGDGIELDVILDADIDLVVDAAVDVAADVNTVLEANLSTGGGGRRR